MANSADPDQLASFKGGTYPGSAGLGLILNVEQSSRLGVLFYFFQPRGGDGSSGRGSGGDCGCCFCFVLICFDLICLLLLFFLCFFFFFFFVLFFLFFCFCYVFVCSAFFFFFFFFIAFWYIVCSCCTLFQISLLNLQDRKKGRCVLQISFSQTRSHYRKWRNPHKKITGENSYLIDNNQQWVKLNDMECVTKVISSGFHWKQCNKQKEQLRFKHHRLVNFMSSIHYTVTRVVKS